MERLGDVIVRPDLQTDHHVDHVGPAGEHDDAHTGAIRLRPDLAGQLKPVLAGQNEVQEHQIDLHARQALPHGRAIGGSADLKALTSQIAGEHLTNFGIVVDDQDVRRVCHLAKIL